MRMAAVADNEDLRLEGISIGVGLRVAPGITKAEATRTYERIVRPRLVRTSAINEVSLVCFRIEELQLYL